MTKLRYKDDPVASLLVEVDDDRLIDIPDDLVVLLLEVVLVADLGAVVLAESVT